MNKKNPTGYRTLTTYDKYSVYEPYQKDNTTFDRYGFSKYIYEPYQIAPPASLQCNSQYNGNPISNSCSSYGKAFSRY